MKARIEYVSIFDTDGNYHGTKVVYRTGIDETEIGQKSLSEYYEDRMARI